ncbi:MAG: hypothetical protein NZZ41_02870 [Candidatus Dojkabacteria bacterium]|nr:hypothetical protein [Candidatus Dojkabacteria bacterium]
MRMQNRFLSEGLDPAMAKEYVEEAVKKIPVHTLAAKSRALSKMKEKMVKIGNKDVSLLKIFETISGNDIFDIPKYTGVVIDDMMIAAYLNTRNVIDTGIPTSNTHSKYIVAELYLKANPHLHKYLK